MNIIYIVEKIKEKWDINSLHPLSEEIDLEVLSSSTSGEIINNVASFLKKIRNDNPRAFALIEQEIRNLKESYGQYISDF